MKTKINFEECWHKINCLVPVTDQNGGNSTQIYMQNGTKVLIESRTYTVLKNLAKVFALDILELKKKHGKLVGRKSSTPLVFHPKLILLPLKVREVLVKDEGARGYIVNNQINNILSLEAKKTRIFFYNGTYLDCLQSINSINLVRAHGRIIAREYESSLAIHENENVYRVVQALLSSLEGQNTFSDFTKR